MWLPNRPEGSGDDCTLATPRNYAFCARSSRLQAATCVDLKNGPEELALKTVRSQNGRSMLEIFAAFIGAVSISIFLAHAVEAYLTN
jgi:hypothetical protein